MPLHEFPLIANSRSRQSEVLVTHQPTKVDLQNILDDKPQSLTVKTFGEIAVIVNDQAQSGKVIFAEPPPDLTLLARTYSQKPGDRQVEVTVDFPEATERYELDLTVVRLCLDVDADRDGLVDYDNPAKQTWHWGELGQGAIYLVNSDQDWDSSSDIPDFDNRRINTVQDWQDLTPLVIRKTGLAGLPRHYDLWLVLGKNARNRVRIFEDVNTSGGRELVGPGNPAERINWRDTQTELTLALEGLRYLDQDFDGMVDVYLSLERYERPYGEDLVRLRCAPWIMTPNTLSPDTVYIAEVDNNGETVQALRPVVGLGKAQLDLVPPELNEGDRWLQDELEIGYTQTPHHRLTVCLESPRLRGLEFFPESLIGPDVGYVMRGLEADRTRLDSFGNLEVSPPVTVGSKRYPLGRILYGDTDNSIPSHARRHFQPAIRNFLMAQRVQAPIKLFSDWLNVGHIDEFMTFVPANSGKGFKLLLDSPHRCYSLLQKLQDQGKGALELRGGKRLSGRSAAISISKLLADEELSTLNDQFQQAIATNETILRRELGLDGGDILYLPMIFEGTDRRNRGVQRADSFFPNMVNMIVLGTHLAIPKPFGPIIDGVCQLEQMVRDMLEPEGLTCHFIDDWDSYFKKFGELHCGTNVKRRPSTFPWWQMALDS